MVERVELSVFESDFCRVEYREEDGAVFLAWKQFCRLEDYRRPASFALELLRAHPGSVFIADATNGFEDDPADVEWGFSFLLPAMAETRCRGVAFVMDKVSEIEEEMDLWTREFRKYFTVEKAGDYASALQKMKSE